MRAPVPEHKTVYLRFHKRVDAMLTEFSAKTGMRRATAVVWIQNRYMAKLTARGIPMDALTRDDLGFTGVEEPYFIVLGRGNTGEGSMLGRAMQITVDRHTERNMELIAMQADFSLRDFRTAILVDYFAEIGILR